MPSIGGSICGVKYEDVVTSINKTIEQNKATLSRSKVMLNLELDLGISPDEAEQIANAYYGAYRSFIKPLIRQENIKNTVEVKVTRDFFHSQANTPKMTETDWDAVEKIYEKAEKAKDANAISLAAKFENEAMAMIINKSGHSNDAAFSAWVYNRPLGSIAFVIKSWVSNQMETIFGKFTSKFFEGGTLDLKQMGDDYNNMAKLWMKYVYEGGNPISDHLKTETTLSTNVNLLQVKGWFSKSIKYFNDKISRAANMPDTLGIAGAAERHLYDLYKQYYYEGFKGQPNAKENSKIAATKAMQLMEKSQAETIAEALYRDLGMKLDKNDTEYKLTVEQIRREARDPYLNDKAMLLAAEDFYKQRMTVRSDVGFAKDGIMGLWAQLLGSVKDKFSSTNLGKSKVGQITNLNFFGFLNGANAWLEKVIELNPIYATTKILAGQVKVWGTQNNDLRNDIKRVQRKLISKQIVTATVLGSLQMMKYILEKRCKDGTIDNIPQSTIYGDHRYNICGKSIPIIMPPQLNMAHSFYSFLYDRVNPRTDTEKENFLLAGLKAFTAVAQETRMPNGFMGKINDYVNLYKDAKNDESREKISSKIWNLMAKQTTNFGSSFLFYPNRIVSEVGAFVNTSEAQQQLPQYGKNGKYGGLMNLIVNATSSSILNTIGVGDFIGNNITGKDYNAVDWQGREVGKIKNGYLWGDGIKYNKYDAILTDMQMPLPYIKRDATVIVKTTEKEAPSIVSSKGINFKDVQTKYLSAEQFNNAYLGVAKFYKEWWDNNYNAVEKKFYHGTEIEQKAIKKDVESLHNETFIKYAINAAGTDKSVDAIYQIMKEKSKKSKELTESEKDTQK
jgi:hypothetical protein